MADCMRLFDRYSNTLLVSLNNRISIRDAYGARDVDRQVVMGPSNSAHSEAIIVSETDESQNNLMGQPAAEDEVKESK